MKPRLKSSKKWTAFPLEFTQQIQSLFEENLKKHLTNDKIVIEGRIYSEEILLRVGINTPKQLKQSNFEVSIEYSAEANNAIEKIQIAVDAAASMMLDYLETPEGEIIDFPEIWKEFPFGEDSVYLQFSTVNTDLEAQADALLGEFKDEMVHEEMENDSEDLYDQDPSEIESSEDESESDSKDDNNTLKNSTKRKLH